MWNYWWRFTVFYWMRQPTRVLQWVQPTLFISKLVMREKFYFFDSFRDTIKSINDPVLKTKYMEAIIDYGITWEYSSDNEMVNVLMVQTKFTLDRSQEISNSASERWHKWWAPKGNKNACKNLENISKQPKTSKNKLKQTKTNEEEVEEEVEEENNILSTNVDNSKAEYWDKEINECLEMIWKFNDWIVDWTIKEQRQYAKLLIWKLKKIDSVKIWNYTWNQVLETILQIVSQNTYHAQKIAWPKKIFYELWSLMQICKSEVWKQKSMPFISWIW